jgi:hypothetical protein
MDELSLYVVKTGIWDNFRFDKMLGEGSFGKVFLAEPTSSHLLP